MYAHGGIVAAAAAILADMEQHNLLARLLEEYDPLDQHHQQPSHRSDIFATQLSLRHQCYCLQQTVMTDASTDP